MLPSSSGATSMQELLEAQPAVDPSATAVFEAEYERRLFRWAAEDIRGEFAPATWQGFWLTAVEGQAPSDVAASLGSSVGAIYVARSRVLARLKRRIEQLGPKTSVIIGEVDHACPVEPLSGSPRPSGSPGRGSPEQRRDHPGGATHLEQCDTCRESFDRLIGDERWLGAVRRHLGSEPSSPAEPNLQAHETLEFLTPSDWPDSLGRLGSYEIKGLLGRGGMGVVLKAFDPVLRRNVAIKVLSAALATSGAARQRFLREARAAAAVVFPHVVAVYAVVESAGLPFLVMEYVPGPSLQERLDKQGPLALAEILRIGMQTAAGLACKRMPRAWCIAT